MTFQSQTFQTDNVSFSYVPRPPAIVARTPRQVANKIVREICEQEGCHPADLKVSGYPATHRLAWIRYKCFAAIRERLGWSYPHIGRYFGGISHTTVLKGVQRFEARMAVRSTA